MARAQVRLCSSTQPQTTLVPRVSLRQYMAAVQSGLMRGDAGVQPAAGNCGLQTWLGLHMHVQYMSTGLQPLRRVNVYLLRCGGHTFCCARSLQNFLELGGTAHIPGASWHVLTPGVCHGSGRRVPRGGDTGASER